MNMRSGSVATPVVPFKKADYACNIANAAALKRDLLPLAAALSTIRIRL